MYGGGQGDGSSSSIRRRGSGNGKQKSTGGDDNDEQFLQLATSICSARHWTTHFLNLSLIEKTLVPSSSRRANAAASSAAILIWASPSRIMRSNEPRESSPPSFCVGVASSCCRCRCRGEPGNLLRTNDGVGYADDGGSSDRCRGSGESAKNLLRSNEGVGWVADAVADNSRVADSCSSCSCRW